MSYEEVEIILYVQADNQIWLRWFACKICWLAISKSLSWLNCEPGLLEIILSFCSYSIALRVLIWCLHMWCWTRCFPFLVSICWLNGCVPLNSLPPLLTSCSLGWCQDPAELHSRKGPSLSCNGRSWCRKIGVPFLLISTLQYVHSCSLHFCRQYFVCHLGSLQIKARGWQTGRAEKQWVVTSIFSFPK